jgi:hypothetical protein
VTSREKAIAFYERILHFAVASQTATSSALGSFFRFEAPASAAGSLAIQADDLDALHIEVELAAGCPGVFRVDARAGRTQRTSFCAKTKTGCVLAF